MIGESLKLDEAGKQPSVTGGFRFAWPVAVCVLTALLTVIAFPPFNVAEAAYVFAVPALLWFWRGPSFRQALLVLFTSHFIVWLILIYWLRHVTYPGFVFASALLGLYASVWYLAAWRWLPALRDREWRHRLVVLAGLAGLWVVLEWIRSFFLSGFPWLTLAASQWERPLLLQVAAWTGAYGLSFVFIFFNLALASYFYRMMRFYRQGWRRLAPEFYIALGLLLAVGFGSYRASIAHGQDREAMFRTGIVHPDIPQDIKWDRAHAAEILGILERETLLLTGLEPDLIVWPEAVIPIPLVGRPFSGFWVEGVAREAGVPLLVGSMADESDDPSGDSDWRNAAFLVDPEEGVAPAFYSKRKLVPFGEYIPFHSLWPWMSRIVPIGGNIRPGESDAPLIVQANGREWAAGVLICYEDVFPALARRTVREGADFLAVISNNAWYGKEGMPAQHAAHSVLRAVENRRPVIRSTNRGWSGWIDEYGNVREVMLDRDGSYFFRGGTAFLLHHDPRWANQQSFYTRYGDWFVAASALLVLLALARERFSR